MQTPKTSKYQHGPYRVQRYPMTYRYVKPPANHRVRIVSVRRQRPNNIAAKACQYHHGLQNRIHSREQESISPVRHRHHAFVHTVGRITNCHPSAGGDAGKASPGDDMAFPQHSKYPREVCDKIIPELRPNCNQKLSSNCQVLQPLARLQAPLCLIFGEG